MNTLSDFARQALNPDATHVLPVHLGARSYNIHIGSGLLNDAANLIRATLGAQRRTIIVTDSHVAAPYAENLHKLLQRNNLTQEPPIVTPAVEQSKSFSYLSFLRDQLFQLHIDRKTVLIALGGGVVGDLVGFAASIALRGIDFIQIPTTLLAQVDSSVGGKTGINSPRGKNLIGSFHQPRQVIIDVDTLKTLPMRELRAGYAEIVKYGLIRDRKFYEWLEGRGHNLLNGKKEKQIHAIQMCCQMKAGIIASDEKETSHSTTPLNMSVDPLFEADATPKLSRALLNLGHTFAHAFEAATNFSNGLLHGEAVALGCIKAFELSERLGLCPEGAAARIRDHFKQVELPVSIKGRGFEAGKLIAHMYNDKKAEGGQLIFVLAKGIGEAFVERHLPAAEVRAV